MPFISQESIDQVKHQVNILDVVSQAVVLKRSGSQYRGLSPFSNEKTPSFYVNPDKNVFYCYSTGQGGNVITFVQLYEKLTFPEAVETLAERFQIPLRYEGGEPSPQSRSLRKEILEIHERATDHFHRRLLGGEGTAADALRYWTEERGFPLDLAVEFKVGFAPPEPPSPGGNLASELARAGHSPDALRRCGLFYCNEHDSDPARFRDRFRGRLMVPIRNYQGQVIAFTARQLPSTPQNDPSREAKYINSPETPLFDKGKIVFGLDVARHHIDPDDAGRAAFILVEGQLDALRCWQHGLRTAVAPQGTAVTAEQLLLLKRYSSRVDCILDGDPAGQKAALRLLPLALKAGIEIRFLPLPGGEDPDTLLAAGGAAAFDDLRGRARSAMAFAADSLLPSPDPSPRERTEALQAIYAIVAECEEAVARQAYLEEAARHARVDPTAAAADFARFYQRRLRRAAARERARAPAGPDAAEEPGTGADPTPEDSPPTRLTTAAYELLWCIFHFDHIGKRVAEVVDGDWIDKSTLHGRLLSRALAELAEDLWEGTRHLERILETDDERNEAYAMIAKEPRFDDPVKIADACIRALLKEFVRGRLRLLEQRLLNAADPAAEFPAVQAQRRALRQLASNAPTISS